MCPLTPHSAHKIYCQYLNPLFLIARNRALSAADLERKHFIFFSRNSDFPLPKCQQSCKYALPSAELRRAAGSSLSLCHMSQKKSHHLLTALSTESLAAPYFPPLPFSKDSCLWLTFLQLLHSRISFLFPLQKDLMFFPIRGEERSGHSISREHLPLLRAGAAGGGQGGHLFGRLFL